jgi:hypothetical protein
VYWWTKAAEQGNADAQYNLGMKHAKGQGVPQDYKQAVYWWTKAAEQGNADAQLILGLMYAKGEGVTQDHKLAYVWCSLASVQGSENAIKARDLVASKLSPHQLSEAQELATQIYRRIESQQKQE